MLGVPALLVVVHALGKLVLKQISQGKETNFKFDWVFNDTQTQVDIYDEIKDVVRSALDGQNVCIFAYG